MLTKQVVTIPISQGLDLKTDEKQVMSGKSIFLDNVRFFKTGKINKRFGLLDMTNITSTGTLDFPFAIVSDNKMINTINDEGVFSLSSASGQWEKMSEMKDLVKVKSEFLSKSAYNHFNPDMDFDVNFGLIATVYREVQENNNLTPNPAEFVTIVLEDIATGVKKIRKISCVNSYDYKKSQQKIMITSSGGVPVISVFFDYVAFRLENIVLDKNLETVVAQNTLQTFTVVTFPKYKLDVCRDNTNIFIASMVESTLTLRKYSLAGVSAASPYVNVLSYRLGTSISGTNGLGFSICQTSTIVHIFFVHNIVPAPNASFLVGIGVNKSTMITAVTETISSSAWPTMRDVSIQANGTTIIAATTEAAIFPSDQTRVEKFTATFAGVYTITEPTILNGVIRSVVLSRPFIYNGINFVVLKCPEATQPTGLIYNMDSEKFATIFSPFGLSASRVVQITAAAFYTGTCNSVIINGMAYTMVEKFYGLDSNSVAAFDFNANIAVSKIAMDLTNEVSSGTKQKLGETNYYTNGPTVSMDARGAHEGGFYLRPKIDSVTSNTSGGTTPGVAGKTFNYIAVYNFYNGKGEIVRSIPSPSVQIVTAANTTYVSSVIKRLTGSFKDKYFLDGSTYTQEYITEVVLYRTTNLGSVFYRVSSAPNSQFSQTVSIADASSDSNISNNETLYTTGGVLESDPTPNAKFSTSGGNRLFLGGLEEEDEIAYSTKQLFGEEVSFSDFLRIRISSGTSSDKSPMSALGYLDGKVIIFRENSMFFIQGDGPNDTGAGGFFTEPEVISSDVGCVDPRSVINGPNGLMFKSKKGIYLLDRSLQTSYIGAAVEAFNTERIVSALVSDKFNEARFYTNGSNCLVYNFLFDSWSTFSGQTAFNADIWKGNVVSLVGGFVATEVEDTYIDNLATYSVLIKTPWLKVSGLQDFSRLYSLNILGEFKSSHVLRVTAYYDYTLDYSEVYDVTPLMSDSQYQYRIHLKKQKCESVQFVIEDISPVGESMTISSLAMEVGLKSGSMKLSAERKY